MRYIIILSFAAIICFTVLLINSEFILNNNENKRLEFEEFIRSHPFNQKETLTPSEWKKKLPKKDRPDLAMEQEYFMTMDPVTKIVPRERLITAYEYADERRDFLHRGSTTAWTEHGPNNVAGRTRAIMFDPNDTSNKKVWVGGVYGGLWYTLDITAASPTWTKVNDFWDNMAVSCIASDPVNPQIFYVGTGEIYTGASRGFGIWKTIDAGLTWTRLTSTENFLWVNDIVVRNESGVAVVYAALGNTNYQELPGNWPNGYEGLYRSTDGGNNWSQVLPNVTGYTVPYQPSDIEIDASNNIWIGTRRNSYGLGAGTILKSTSGNMGSWSSTSFTGYNANRIELACAPSNASVVYVVGAGGSGDNDVEFMVKTANGGIDWLTITIPISLIDGNHFTRGQAWYDLILAVDPTNENTLYAGGIDLYRSIDGGSNWTMISVWHDYYSSLHSRPYVHADQHAIAFRPGDSNTFIAGNDGGVHMTTNGGTDFTAKNSGYNVTQFYSAALHPTAGTNFFLAGSQDNGTQKFENATGVVNTIEVTGGDGAFSFIDQDNASLSITSYTYNNYYVNTDGWATSNYTTISCSRLKSGRFINPSDYDNKNNILYAASGNDSIRFISGFTGTNPSLTEGFWQTALMGGAQASHIRVSEYTLNTIFVGTGGGRLLKVVNAHTISPTVTVITGLSFPLGYISCVELGASEDQILVTFSNYGVTSIWESLDGGATWARKDVNLNLPDMPVRWALYNPNNRNEVIVATDVGIWKTSDLNATTPTWAPLPTSDGLANVRVDMLQIRQSDNLVIAATHGRGLFSSTMFQGGTCTATEVANSDQSATGSVTGTTGVVVSVTCDAGYSGGGNWTCGTDGTFTGTVCSSNSCTATEVANSDQSATGSVTGTTGVVVSVTCDAGYSGGGNWTCGTDGTFTGTVCLDDDECILEIDNCDSNATCTNTVGSFTCSCNSGYSGDGTTGNCTTLFLYSALIPEEYSIHNIYPNPFNPVANIKYGVAENSKVQIVIYDMSGKHVESIVNEFQTPGYYSVSWNADNQPSGVYFVKMIADEYVTTQKLMLVK